MGQLYDYLKPHQLCVNGVNGFSKPFRRIRINDKEKSLDDNKKYLVNRIVDSVEDEFPNLDKN